MTETERHYREILEEKEEEEREEHILFIKLEHYLESCTSLVIYRLSARSW